jgi:hypothetical protein
MNKHMIRGAGNGTSGRRNQRQDKRKQYSQPAAAGGWRGMNIPCHRLINSAETIPQPSRRRRKYERKDKRKDESNENSNHIILFLKPGKFEMLSFL